MMLFSFSSPGKLMLSSVMASLITLSAAVVPAHAEPQAEAPESTESSETAYTSIPITELRVFAEVMERIRAAYVEDVSDKALLESAIRGMLYELDPHSSYMTPDQFSDLQATTTGEFGGLGIEITMEEGALKVVSPLDDTPASRAGIQAGDIILKIDDTFVKGLSLSEAVDLMRGEVGTRLTLSILREGEDKPLVLELTRAIVRIQSVRTQMLEPGYGYLRITQFQNNSGADAAKAISGLLKDGPLHGLVLDLRNNPGGVLNAAVNVSDLFLDSGLIVYTAGRDGEQRLEYAATPGDQIPDTAIVVLVNSGSASASEIVAGALQDHGRAIVVGNRTFGKGSVQTVLPLHGDRALKLTTARYFTPSGRSIQAEGIQPDIPVAVTHVEVAADQGQYFREANLRRHLENGNAGRTDATSPDATQDDAREPPLAERDYPLYQALSILKGIHLAGQKKSAMPDHAHNDEGQTR